MMTKAKRTTKGLSEEEKDTIVTAQADDDSAWEQPVRVKKPKSSPLAIPADLAARAAFLAGLHRASGVEDWLARIIRERIELEEVAFVEAKRDLATKKAPNQGAERTRGRPRATQP